MAGRITLLLDRFPALIAAAGQAQRFGALETLLARGKFSNHGNLRCNELRFALFGQASEGPLPIAAMTRMADSTAGSGDDHYRLRLDPVSLWADMARVVMTRCGFADLTELERNEIENTVRSVLFQEGFNLDSDHPERWTIALKQSLPFDFTSLEESLGMDAADVLPDHPEALYWRRILNEIQMALHACPANIRRRQLGQVEINSVWFWGGGFVPPVSPTQLYQTVYSNHPISRGLALLQQCVLHDSGAVESAVFEQLEENILIDWSRPDDNPVMELGHLEQFVRRLLERVQTDGRSIHLCTSGGAGWVFDRRSSRRWWSRLKPLGHYQDAFK